MASARAFVACAVLLSLAACKKDPPPPPADVKVAPLEPAAPAPAPVLDPKPNPGLAPADVKAAVGEGSVPPSEAVTPEPPRAAATPTEGPDDGDPVAAYVADCHHRFTAAYDEMGEEKRDDECLAQDFDQNCAPDVYGCWNALEACKKDCGQGCVSCQEKCAGGCDTCKERCAKAKQPSSCARDCAEARQACRQECMGGRQSCVDGTCPAKEKKCEDDGEAKKAKKCPQCAELESCLSSLDLGDPDAAAKCGKKYPRNAKECLDWCAPAP
ncbi:MAG: hypothetical protein K1X89_16325 [Myxococcaceae bacterium]|nr:hypothetical protein [Myxococcaceae bacterium]